MMPKLTLFLVLALLSLGSVLAMDPCVLHTHCLSYPSSSSASVRQSATPRRFTQIPILVNRQNLTLTQRQSLLKSASLIFAELNPHRPLINALHDSDPATKLNALLRDPALASIPPFDFHALLRDIFSSAHDFHTVYLPPEPLRSTQLSLGFSVQSFVHTSSTTPRFLVSAVSDTLRARVPTSFRKGVRVLRVDGQDVFAHVWDLGQTTYAANPQAVIARGVDALTVRPLALVRVPNNPVVKITYLTPASREHTISLEWTPEPITDAYLLSVLDRAPPISTTARKSSSSPSSRMSFVPSGGREYITVAPEFAVVFDAYILRTISAGAIGVLHIKTFAVNANPLLLAELTRVLSLLPTTGLVIDVRGNWGGTADLAKAITELFSTVSIPSMPMQMQASSLVGKIVSADSPADTGKAVSLTFRAAWHAANSVKEYHTTPASNLFTLGLPAPYPVQPRVYTAPVVTLMDARSFSAAEVFVALQRDTGASTVVGVDDNTAGGGAATVRFSVLQLLYPSIFGGIDVGQDVNFRTAVIRFFRMGLNSGAFVEKFGVEPDLRYNRTKTDIVNDDALMFEYLGDLLKKKAS